MMPVKICGITRKEDIEMCAGLGAGALGLVVEYPAPVPWNLTLCRARGLRQAMPPSLAVCMVAGGAAGDIIARAKLLRPDFVQLHHNESLADVRAIASALHPLGIRIIKALRIGPDGELMFEIPEIKKAARLLSRAGADALLVDSGTAERPGGSGIVANPDAYRQAAENSQLPVVLAGGLTPGNLHRVVPGDIPPAAVDVLSGVETLPGRKDEQKVRAFLRAARGLSGPPAFLPKRREI